MRVFVLALLAIAPSCAIDQAYATDRLPAFEIARNCQQEVVGSGTSVASCTKAETGAKDELTTRWSQFNASDKNFCVGTSSIGGDQSYVELLTCLEMSSGKLGKPQE